MIQRTRRFLQIVGMIPATLLVATSLLPASPRPPHKPNIIIIFTDDQGYQDLGCFGSALIKTPNIDHMAKEGMKFTDFYSASSICSPSRAALLTGCYPPRVSITSVLFPKDTVGLHPDEITIADMLKGQGYATACIGKWHLGHLPEFLPTKQGFDSYFGIPYSNDMTIDKNAQFADDIVFREDMDLKKVRTENPKAHWVPLMRDEKVIEYPSDQMTLTKRYTEEAIRFIMKNKDYPFFLYLPHTMPHIPIFVSEKFMGKSKRGLYGDAIMEIDWSTGEILRVLKSLGIDEYTLIIFTSDNGPWNLKDGQGGDAFPLRGYKFQTYEGGMRVPAIMRWPGKIPSGVVCSEIVSTIDILPTIASVTGTTFPEGRVIDGKNIWPLMSTKKGAKTPHDAFFYYTGNKCEAVRSGKWKLHREKQIELYNLEVDISEQNNLAPQHLEVVQSLIKVMDDFDRELKAHTRPAGQLNGK